MWALLFVGSAGGRVGVLWRGGIDVAYTVFGRAGLDFGWAGTCGGWIVALRPGRLDGMAGVCRWIQIGGLICLLIFCLLMLGLIVLVFVLISGGHGSPFWSGLSLEPGLGVVVAWWARVLLAPSL